MLNPSELWVAKPRTIPPSVAPTAANWSYSELPALGHPNGWPFRVNVTGPSVPVVLNWAMADGSKTNSCIGGGDGGD